MQPTVLRTVFLVVVIALLAGLLVGCGGGGGQSEGGSQDGGSGGSEQQNGDGGSEQQNDGGADQQRENTEEEKAGQKVKVALGTIESVTPEQRQFTLQPSAEEQGEEPIPFNVRPNTIITDDGQLAELADLTEGQHAKVNYRAVDGENRARHVAALGD